MNFTRSWESLDLEIHTMEHNGQFLNFVQFSNHSWIHIIINRSKTTEIIKEEKYMDITIVKQKIKLWEASCDKLIITTTQ